MGWGSKRLENSLIVRGPFLARTTCRAIVAKDRIFRFKKLSTNSDIIVEKLRRRLLFCREASREQLKEDGPRLISVYKHSAVQLMKQNRGAYWNKGAYSIRPLIRKGALIGKTDSKGALLERECLLERGR